MAWQIYRTERVCILLSAFCCSQMSGAEGLRQESCAYLPSVAVPVQIGSGKAEWAHSHVDALLICVQFNSGTDLIL